jgi:hypothetical protein
MKYKRLFPMFKTMGFTELYSTAYEHMVEFYEYFGCKVVQKRKLNGRDFYLIHYSEDDGWGIKKDVETYSCSD